MRSLPATTLSTYPLCVCVWGWVFHFSPVSLSLSLSLSWLSLSISLSSVVSMFSSLSLSQFFPCCIVSLALFPSTRTMGGNSSRPRPINLAERDGVCNNNRFSLAISGACTLHLCTCGLSSKPPYCSGAHIQHNKDHGTSFTPYRITVPGATLVQMCECGHSNVPPFCVRDEQSVGSSITAEPCNYSYHVDIEPGEATWCGMSSSSGRVALYEPEKSIDEQAPPRPRREKPYVVSAKALNRYMFCACGQSGTMPMCDGAHIAYNREHNSHLRPFSVDMEESKTLHVCGCGLSRDKPFCDGSHVALQSFSARVPDPDLKDKGKGEASTSTGAGLRTGTGGAGAGGAAGGGGGGGGGPGPVVVTSLTEYTAVTVVSVKEVWHEVFRYRVRLPQGVDFSTVLGSDCWFRFKHDGRTLERVFTPLKAPSLEDEDQSQGILIDFHIKRYENGLFSNYVRNIGPGATLELKGPSVRQCYERNEFTHFYCICAGIGIVPFIQLMRTIDADKKDHTRVSLLISQRKEIDMLFKSELDAYVTAKPKRYLARYILTTPTGEYPEEYSGRLDATKIASFVPMKDPQEAIKIGICGPIAFIQMVTVCLRSLGYEESDLLTLC